MTEKAKKRFRIFSLIALIGDLAGNANDGKAKSASCAACHGADGNSANPTWPKLAGQGAPYIVKQLADFKAKKRNDPLMSSQAMALSSQDHSDTP